LAPDEVIVMRFRIKRVDYTLPPGSPCEGAYQLPGKTGDSDSWYIDIATLEELMSLMAAVGKDLILTPRADFHSGTPGITIYDDYVE
jgi:hypothetical protein